MRHISPFENLQSHKNDFELPADFIKSWVIPFYMKLGSDSYAAPDWIKSVEDIKDNITQAVCLSLLGDFNWRSRLVGAYFAAVKGYIDLIEIIGTHLVKSEVCCVGHIYALTLAFFNNEKSAHYLNEYLGYYLKEPALNFDQKRIVEAILYLDKINGTSVFDAYIESWELFQQERKKITEKSAIEIAKLLENLKKLDNAEKNNEILKFVTETRDEKLATEYFDKQIVILKELSQ
jgi:uncharacterized protein DUF6000